MSISYEITEFLSNFEPTSATVEQVEKLEDYIQQANNLYQKETDETVTVADSIYDSMREAIKIANPDSELIQQIWESEDDSTLDVLSEYQDQLSNHPMRSINTCKSVDCKEFQEFKSVLVENQVNELFASMKINGWGTQIAYANGQFIFATTRGRSTKARDITRQLQVILAKDDLDYIEDFKDSPFVLIRGEVALPFYNLEEARTYNPNIVSAFTGVASMIKPASTPEENSCLSFIAYAMYSEGYSPQTKLSEYEDLENLGFEVPKNFVINVELYSLEEDMLNLCEELEEDTLNGYGNEEDAYHLYTDGIVIQVNDNDKFIELGHNDHHNFGNAALKIGAWKQDNYNGYLQYIMYTKGKSNLIPVAIVAEEKNMAIFQIEDRSYSSVIDLVENEELDRPIEDYVVNYRELGVPTVSGNKVRRVPLYNFANILRLGLEENSVIHFKYGGEAGVVPCNENGSNIKDASTGVLENLYYQEDYIFGDKQ